MHDGISQNKLIAHAVLSEGHVGLVEHWKQTMERSFATPRSKKGMPAWFFADPAEMEAAVKSNETVGFSKGGRVFGWQLAKQRRIDERRPSECYAR
jgi:hypothetical protein